MQIVSFAEQLNEPKNVYRGLYAVDPFSIVYYYV